MALVIDVVRVSLRSSIFSISILKRYERSQHEKSAKFKNHHLEFDVQCEDTTLVLRVIVSFKLRNVNQLIIHAMTIATL